MEMDFLRWPFVLIVWICFQKVYTNVFQPLKVSKQQFKKIVKCMKQIQALKRGELFAIEKQTKVETLSLLLSGRYTSFNYNHDNMNHRHS